MGDTTIQDFGAQWTRYSDNSGYYGSLELFQDICGPLLDVHRLKGRRVVDVGSGSGRIVNMLLDAGVAHVVAVEPSAAMTVLKENTRARAHQIRYVQADGSRIPDVEVDYVFSIGVLHHIPDPAPTVRRAREVLKPGGEFLFWVYGREGNRLYLALASLLRKITPRLPDFLLVTLSHALNLVLDVYILLCRFLPLPLRTYVTEHLARLSRHKRFLTIFDQLNPAYAKFYTRQAALELMRGAGFRNVRLHHRHGYSWTVIGENPAGAGTAVDGQPDPVR